MKIVIVQSLLNKRRYACYPQWKFKRTRRRYLFRAQHHYYTSLLTNVSEYLNNNAMRKNINASRFLSFVLILERINKSYITGFFGNELASNMSCQYYTNWLFIANVRNKILFNKVLSPALEAIFARALYDQHYASSIWSNSYVMFSLSSIVKRHNVKVVGKPLRCKYVRRHVYRMRVRAQMHRDRHIRSRHIREY
jgi:hypothetical protein